MKKLLAIALLSLLTNSVFAKTCVVATAKPGSTDFENTIATYTNIETRETMIMTVITKDGEIMTDLNLETYYDGVTTQEEVDARTKKLKESQISIISIEEEENQLTLAIGTGQEGEELLKTDVMSMADLSSSKSAVFDMNKRMTIYCVD